MNEWEMLYIQPRQFHHGDRVLWDEGKVKIPATVIIDDGGSFLHVLIDGDEHPTEVFVSDLEPLQPAAE